jgi:hypothetical protein
MPPFLSTNCIHCKKPNRFDLAELRKKDGSLTKGMIYRSIQTEEEFEVTCQHCGRKFKFLWKGTNDGEEK